ncbi:MAG TPA: asparagine synthase (glutamine-hydrolyzing), partial [Planctomycetota bacterium]|nr:asparagine synthase (glutamine-hydrolyzing) [Planctomycetota bacterium]
MCGLSGVVRWDGRPADLEQLKKMAACIAHRGPDDQDFWVSGEGPARAGLGFRRLAIIDLSGGRQPMASASGRTRIVFNGEIYNFKELRADLEKRGCKFNTRSDTEVILQAYETFGEDCVRRLRGMFAFAIWDDQKKSLFMARDRMGKKPLFYARKGQALYFASELKALLKSGEIARDVNLDAIPLYFAYQFIPSPMTIFSGVERLPPAHWLTCDAKGTIRTERYWKLPRMPHLTDDVPALCEELRSKLEEATRIRLVSDVPLGAFLSGGIDSSAVVGYMAKNSTTPVKTFSIGFEEQDFSELEYARKVAKHFATDHHEFVVKPDAAEILPKLAWHYDQPFADPSALPSYYVARETRKHVTVALNGDGGDESFGGYLRYQADRVFQSLSQLPKP